jgi:hypothetical protein
MCESQDRTLTIPNLITHRKHLMLRKSTAGGLGLFATASLPRGHFVCLYAGEFIGQDEAYRRFTKQEAAGHGNYMLCMRENDRVIGFVDPTCVGNVGWVP